MPTATAAFAALLAATKKPTTTTGGSIESILFIFIVFGVIYFVFLRPRSQAARRQRNTLMELSPGDEVLTGAGIFGTVLDVEADRVTLETAPGTRITVLRTTIARRITEPDPDPDQGGNSVAEQNWHDEAHDGVAEAADWHDPSEQDPAEAGADHGGDHAAANGSDPDKAKAETEEEPESDGATGTGTGGGR
jgi:preprotein translocase subunit YajC